MLKALNPDVNVIALPTRITVDNVMDTIKDYDLIVDGPTTSRRATWSTTRATCWQDQRARLDLPVRGHGHRLRPNQGPCYRCLYPPPPPGLVPS